MRLLACSIRPALGAFLLTAALASPVLANSLFPPPGPPAPTMKRLDQVSTTRCISSLPHVISEPGTYEVCGNLTGGAAGYGILIESPDVTLDLAGFTLRGGEGSRNGIVVASGAHNVTIRNGSLIGWGTDGINAAASGGDLWCWGLHVRSCNGDGITLSSGHVRDSVVANNRGDGIRVLWPDTDGDGFGDPVHISGVTSTGNLGAGISSRDVPLDVERCVVSRNGGNGVCGQRTVPSSSVQNPFRLAGVKSSGNGGSGITVHNFFIEADRCVTDGNVLHGLHLLLDDGIVAPDMKLTAGYNNTRSNKASSISSSANGGNGLLVETDLEVPSSFVLSDSSLSGNGGDGVLLSPLSEDSLGMALRLARCETNNNTGTGVSVTVRNTPPKLESCMSNGNGGHGYSLVLRAPSDAVKAAAKTYNSTRSNRTGGISNGGSGFHIEVEGGVVGDITISQGDFSGNGEHGIALAPAASGSGAGKAVLSTAFDAVRTNSNAMDGVSLSAGTADSSEHEIVCKTRHLSSSGNGGNGLSADGVREVSLHSSNLSGNGGHGAAMTSHFAADFDSLAYTYISFSSVYNDNGADGVHIHCPAVNVSLSSCLASGNEGAGARTVSTSKADAKKALDGFVSRNNGEDGIHVSGPVSVSLDRCEASSNGGHGLAHIIDHLDPDDDGDGIPTRIENSSFHGNDFDGVHLSLMTEAVVHRDLAARNVHCGGNGGNGIHMDHRQGDLLLPSSASFVETVCVNNGSSGMRIFADVCVVRSSSASSNADAGMRLYGSSVTVADSTLARNDGGQLWCWGRGSVRHCNVGEGEGDGIHVADGIFDIRDNFISGSRNAAGTAMGIRVPDANSIIRGNALIDNDQATSLAADDNPLYESTGIGHENPVYRGDD